MALCICGTFKETNQTHPLHHLNCHYASTMHLNIHETLLVHQIYEIQCSAQNYFAVVAITESKLINTSATSCNIKKHFQMKHIKWSTYSKTIFRLLEDEGIKLTLGTFEIYSLSSSLWLWMYVWPQWMPKRLIGFDWNQNTCYRMFKCLV